MSVNRTYKMPWRKLDKTVIRTAALAITENLPGVAVEIDSSSPTSIRCYFAIPQDIARAWEGPELDRWFAPGQPPIADPMLIEIGFIQLEADSDLPTDLFLMSADMGYCCNGMLWNLAVEIMNRFCEHWQIEPERW
jgi:hypothetical protein